MGSINGQRQRFLSRRLRPVTFAGHQPRFACTVHVQSVQASFMQDCAYSMDSPVVTFLFG